MSIVVQLHAHAAANHGVEGRLTALLAVTLALSRPSLMGAFHSLQQRLADKTESGSKNLARRLTASKGGLL